MNNNGSGVGSTNSTKFNFDHIEDEVFSEKVLDAFKHAITGKARVFARGRQRRPKSVILGQNQLKMLKADSVARWMLENMSIEESKEKSKLQFR